MPSGKWVTLYASGIEFCTRKWYPFFLRQLFHFEEKAMLLTNKQKTRKQVAATFFDSLSLFVCPQVGIIEDFLYQLEDSFLKTKKLRTARRQKMKMKRLQSEQPC